MNTITKCYGCAPALIAWLYNQLHPINEDIVSNMIDRKLENDQLHLFDEDLVRDVFLNTLEDLKTRSSDRIINEVKSPGGVTEKILNKLNGIEINEDPKMH